jgi:repressor LexA
MEPLTKRQAQILAFIRDHISAHGYAPSYREIGGNFGLSSTATIAEHIESLRAKGYLTQEENLARSIQLTEVPNEQSLLSSMHIPLLGVIAAGKPIEAVPSRETIEIPRDMCGHNVYALRVRGNSMIEDGIFDNDYVIVEQVRTARNGDIVVALVDNDSVTLKRFYKERDRIRLQPANSTMRPLYVTNVDIQGKVKGLIRKFA